MRILGLSALYHDSAAALIENGEILAAAQEERFSRVKHDQRFPINAINYCLKSADININEIDFVTFYDKPFLKFERLLETYLAFMPKGFSSFRQSMPAWLKDKLFQTTKEAVERGTFGAPTFFIGNEMFFGHDRINLIDNHLQGKI